MSMRNHYSSQLGARGLLVTALIGASVWATPGMAAQSKGSGRARATQPDVPNVIPTGVPGMPDGRIPGVPEGANPRPRGGGGDAVTDYLNQIKRLRASGASQQPSPAAT